MALAERVGRLCTDLQLGFVDVIIRQQRCVIRRQQHVIRDVIIIRVLFVRIFGVVGGGVIGVVGRFLGRIFVGCVVISERIRALFVVSGGFVVIDGVDELVVRCAADVDGSGQSRRGQRLVLTAAT